LADAIVRNDEVVGSSPTSSTIFSIAYGYPLTNPVPFCPKKFKLAGSLPRIFGNFLRLIPNLAETIAAINAARIAGKTNNEIRDLVARLEAAPKECLR
jgi:hypothetical protein